LLSRYSKPQRLKPLESRTLFGTNKVVPFPNPASFGSRPSRPSYCLFFAGWRLVSDRRAASFTVFISDGGTVPACGRVGSPRCASKSMARSMGIRTTPAD
jgi:hypothetical protein